VGIEWAGFIADDGGLRGVLLTSAFCGMEPELGLSEAHYLLLYSLFSFSLLLPLFSFFLLFTMPKFFRGAREGCNGQHEGRGPPR